MFKINDFVTPRGDHDRVPPASVGQVYRVVAVPGGARKKVRAEALEPGQRGINFDPELLINAGARPDAAEELAKQERDKLFAPRPFKPLPIPEQFDLGTIVTLRKPYVWRGKHADEGTWGTDTPLVVVRQTNDRLSLHKLGGSRLYLRVATSGVRKHEHEHVGAVA